MNTFCCRRIKQKMCPTAAQEREHNGHNLSGGHNLK